MATRLRSMLPLAAFAFAAFSASVSAQGLGVGGGDKPIEILARDGIEWHRETQRYIARGDARAIQGDTKVEGDVLTAFYRQKSGSGTDIFRYEAAGNVRISTPTQNGTGEKGVYDVDNSVVVLTGRNLKITTPTEVITSRDSLEYFTMRQVAVARGNAQVITTENRRINADLLSAYFVDGPPPGQAARPAAARPAAARAPNNSPSDNGKRLQRVEGFGGITITTPTEVARGDRGVYNADTGIANLAGHVKITRGDNQLNGDFAEVNTVTGVSRLLNRPGQDERVRGLFIPQDRNQPSTPATPKTK